MNEYIGNALVLFLNSFIFVLGIICTTCKNLAMEHLDSLSDHKELFFLNM